MILDSNSSQLNWVTSVLPRVYRIPFFARAVTYHWNSTKGTGLTEIHLVASQTPCALVKLCQSRRIPSGLEIYPSFVFINSFYLSLLSSILIYEVQQFAPCIHLENLGCFHCLAIMGKTAMNIIIDFCVHLAIISLMLKGIILSHVIIICFIS